MSKSFQQDSHSLEFVWIHNIEPVYRSNQGDQLLQFFMEENNAESPISQI